jgi:hypothetical protein
MARILGVFAQLVTEWLAGRTMPTLDDGLRLPFANCPQARNDSRYAGWKEIVPKSENFCKIPENRSPPIAYYTNEDKS